MSTILYMTCVYLGPGLQQMRSKNSVHTYVNSIVSLLCGDLITEVPDILESLQ